MAYQKGENGRYGDFLKKNNGENTGKKRQKRTEYISYTIINIRPKFRYLTSSQSSGIRARDRDMRHREWERRTEEGKECSEWIKMDPL